MKKIFFIVVLAGILYSAFYNCNLNDSCLGNANNSERKEDVLSSLEKTAFHSGSNNSTFLGLSLGMSLPETFNSLLKLKEQNIITEIDNRFGILGAAYKMNYRGYSNTGKIYCFYTENRLQEVQIDTLQQQSGNLLELFLSKYGDCDYFAENELNKEYHWIAGNQHVTLYSFNNSDRLLVQFIDTTEKNKNQEINLLKNWGVLNHA